MNSLRAYLLTLKNRIEYVAVIILIAALTAFIVSVVRVPEYAAQSRLLIIQKQERIDAFTASKSAEYIASILQEAIYSESFFESLTAKDENLSKHFSPDPYVRSKQWEKKIDTSIISGKGIMVIRVYDSNRDVAQALADLIVSTLIKESATYHGAGDAVTIRLIDSPSTTTKPARPNTPLNVFAGAVIGVGLSAAYVFIATRREQDKVVQPPLGVDPLSVSVAQEEVKPSAIAEETQVLSDTEGSVVSNAPSPEVAEQKDTSKQPQFHDTDSNIHTWIQKGGA